MSTPDLGRGLLGRRSERAVLDLLVSAVRAGESQALVLQGEAGVGKSALLEYVAERAVGCSTRPASRPRWSLRMRGCTSCVPG
jgi:Cdc6-like AAA superfamily ATPase